MFDMPTENLRCLKYRLISSSIVFESKFTRIFRPAPDISALNALSDVRAGVVSMPTLRFAVVVMVLGRLGLRSDVFEFYEIKALNKPEVFQPCFRVGDGSHLHVSEHLTYLDRIGANLAPDATSAQRAVSVVVATVFTLERWSGGFGRVNSSVFPQYLEEVDKFSRAPLEVPLQVTA